MLSSVIKKSTVNFSCLRNLITTDFVCHALPFIFRKKKIQQFDTDTINHAVVKRKHLKENHLVLVQCPPFSFFFPTQESLE